MRDCCNVVLIGPPGSGKGTQAARLSRRYHIPAISTGDALRRAAAEGRPLGHDTQTVMASGGLVGDAVIIDLVRARLERPDTSGGFVLDGFPRTVRQAQVLDQILESRGGLLAVVLSVPDEELSRRLAVRRTCGGCGVPDALAAPLGNEEQCVLCGAVLARRNDDNAATVMRRLFTYRVQAGPIVGYYRQRDGCTIVDGSKDADLVFARIAAHVDDQLTGRADAAMMGSGPGA